MFLTILILVSNKNTITKKSIADYTIKRLDYGLEFRRDLTPKKHNMKNLLAALLFLLVTKGVQAQQTNIMYLNGTYDLYSNQNGVVATTADQSMTIMTFDNNTFVVQGVSGPLQWMGLGKITDNTGYFDWRFEDGRFGQTTFTINNKGHLVARSVGFEMEYPYVAKKRK